MASFSACDMDSSRVAAAEICIPLRAVYSPVRFTDEIIFDMFRVIERSASKSLINSVIPPRPAEEEFDSKSSALCISPLACARATRVINFSGRAIFDAKTRKAPRQAP